MIAKLAFQNKSCKYKDEDVNAQYSDAMMHLLNNLIQTLIFESHMCHNNKKTDLFFLFA